MSICFAYPYISDFYILSSLNAALMMGSCYHLTQVQLAGSADAAAAMFENAERAGEVETL